MRLPATVTDSARYRKRLWCCSMAAVGLHTAMLLAFQPGDVSGPEFAMGDAPTVEVELVSSDTEVEPPPVPLPAPPPLPPLPENEPPEPPASEEPVKPADEVTEPILETRPVESSTSAPPKSTPPSKRSAHPIADRPPPRINPQRTGLSAMNTPTSAGPGSTQPGYLSNPRPPYPLESKRAREQGTVLLRVSVGTDGRPQSLSVERTSGHPRLDAAAAQGVRRWRFKPATRNGRPVVASVAVPVRFSLH